MAVTTATAMAEMAPMTRPLARSISMPAYQQVESSAVHSVSAGRLRYRLLEPVRQYGLELLEVGGEAERARERHAEHYLALAETAEPELMGPDQASWLGRLAIEHVNLTAALSWALDPKNAQSEERAESGLRLAAALGRFWNAHGPSEGLRWLERGLARGGASSKSVREDLGHAGPDPNTPLLSGLCGGDIRLLPGIGGVPDGDRGPGTVELDVLPTAGRRRRRAPTGSRCRSRPPGHERD
jgi:hypothetical protein